MGAIYLVTLFLGFTVGYTTPAVAQAQAAHFQAMQGNYIHAQVLYMQVLVIFLTNTGLGIIMMTVGYMIAQTTGLWFGTLLIAPIQGYKTGAIIANVSSRGADFILAAIIPHGILELSASFVAMGIGLLLGYHISMKRGEEPNYQGTVIIKKWKRIFYSYVVPMYFVAAIIEVYVTPVVMYVVMH